MRSFRFAAAVVLLFTATACGGAEPDAPAAPGAPVQAPPSVDRPAAGDDEAAVRDAFTEYNQALAASDTATVCALSAPETVDTLVAAVSQQLGQEVGGCEDAFGLVFSTPGAAELARQTAGSSEIQDVTVDGDTATVNWTTDVQGQQAAQSNNMRRIDGRWLLGGTG